LGVVSVISTPISILTKLLPFVEKYKKKQKSETRFINAFEVEIQAYVDAFDEIKKYSKEKITPILDSFGEEIMPHEMDNLMREAVKSPLLFSNLLKAFINFAKACSEVIALKGFMEDLHDTHKFLFDFIYTMKNSYIAENHLLIDGRYFRYFQTYKDEIFEGTALEDIGEAVEELRIYVRKIMRYLEKTPRVKRAIRRRFSKNLSILAKTAENVTAEQTVSKNLITYVPEPLFPLVVLLEEMT
jgi:hypothetical protein